MADTLPTDTHTKLAPEIVPAWTDPISGAQYIHKDLVQVRADWVDRSPPLLAIDSAESFGDVASWAAYVKRYAPESLVNAEDDFWRSYITWNATGLTATLDYHSTIGDPGRCQWLAHYRFTPSLQWAEWRGLANGTAHPQKTVVEKLEELADDVFSPSGADLVALLRNLRATANATATTEYRPDGTTSIAYAHDQVVRVAGQATSDQLLLPPTLTIRIPVLKGDVLPVEIRVRLRVSVGMDAHLGIRMTIEGAERILETVYAERVQQAQALLGDGYTIFRGA